KNVKKLRRFDRAYFFITIVLLFLAGLTVYSHKDVPHAWVQISDWIALTTLAWLSFFLWGSSKLVCGDAERFRPSIIVIYSIVPIALFISIPFFDCYQIIDKDFGVLKTILAVFAAVFYGSYLYALKEERFWLTSSSGEAAKNISKLYEVFLERPLIKQILA